MNKQPIDANRYKGITGIPYYFEQPIAAKLFLIGKPEPFKVLLNLNLYEGEVEVFEDGQYAVIENKKIESIEIDQGEDNDPLTVKITKDKFFLTHYVGVKYKLTEIPRVIIEEREHRPPGEIIIKKRFVKKESFSIANESGTRPIDISKKGIAKVLGKEAEKMAKKQKNKLKKVGDLIQLLEELDK